MNALLHLITLVLLNTAPLAPTDDIDSSQDQIKVEQAVVEWANATFIKHENYKFEHFKAFYTDEYFIQTSRIEMYNDKIESLKTKKENGEYHGSDEQFNADVQKLTDAIKKAEDISKKIDRVTHYETHFWTNIQTKDGITVYYELIVKLNNDYTVVEAVENSSIGKKGPDSKIAYKKESGTLLVLEKQG